MEVSFWYKMVQYHEKRIDQSYIPDLRASFKKYDASSPPITAAHDSASDSTLSTLRTLLFGQSSSTSTIERHTRLADESYNLRRNESIENSLYSSPLATSKSKSLWVEICLLARLRVAFQNFKTTAFTLPSFRQVTIILVPRPPKPSNPTSSPLRRSTGAPASCSSRL